MKVLCESKLSRKRSSAKKVLAGLLMPTLFMLTSCGNSDMDPLVPPTEISYNKEEKETVLVERGNLTPTFKKDIELSGYTEVNYNIPQNKMTEMEMLYKAKFDEVLVSEGDKVSVGDTLISFKSEVLDDRKQDWQSTKNASSLRREHYQNLQALDNNYDYYDDIVDLNEDITLASQYVSDVDDIYDQMNLISESEGTVSFVNESVKNGFMVTNSPIIKVSSDDGYYVLDNSEKANMDKSILNAGTMIDFKVGDRFTAKYALNEYEVEVIPDPNSTASAGDAVSSDKVYFKLVNDDGLHDKTLTIIEEMPEIKDTCYVDKRAIVVYNDEPYVYKVMEDGSYRAVKVVIGDTVGLNIVIKEGVTEGDTLAIVE